jgi:hypothetical protein
MKTRNFLLIVTAAVSLAAAQYGAWNNSANIVILAGSEVGASGNVSDFPILVRLDNGNFNFGEAAAGGADIRFAKEDGTILPYEIELWDATAGKASIWVKMDVVSASSNQNIVMYWGNGSASSESDASAVFQTSNGFAGVWHLGEGSGSANDATTNNNDGTFQGDLPTQVEGLVGMANQFDGEGDHVSFSSVTGIPVGNENYTMYSWVHADGMGSYGIVGWGAWGTGSAVNALRLASTDPTNGILHYWWGNDLAVTTEDLSNQWHQIVVTYNGTTQVCYLDGVQVGQRNASGHSVANADNMRLGSTNNGEFFPGILDEIRVSGVARSADWVKLSYANQGENSLVSSPVASGCTKSFSTPGTASVDEGDTLTVTGTADCALFTKWTIGDSTVANGSVLSWAPGRISSGGTVTLTFHAFYDNAWETLDLEVTVVDAIPDPVFTLNPSTENWNGLDTLFVIADVENLDAIQNSAFPDIAYTWTTSGIIVSRTPSNDTLMVRNARESGTLNVKLCADNSGPAVCDSVDITVEVQDPITVLTPNGGEELTGGSVYDVTWESVGTIPQVHIQYQLDGGSWSTAAINQDNTGTYAWTVPNTPSSSALIRVVSATGGLLDVSDAPFTILEGTSVQAYRSNNGIVFQINGLQRIKSGGYEYNRISIMDLNGGLVKELAITGDRVNWNLEGSNGSIAANGIYLVRLVGKHQTREYKVLVK